MNPDLKIPPRYLPIRLLGSGAFGAVYHALDQELNREVAVKVLLERGETTPVAQRFLREARFAASVRHPNLFEVFEVGVTEDQHPYASFEYIPGLDLHAYFLQKGELPERLWLPVLEGILTGLGELHRVGILHRDLKPENILLDTQERAHIVDLGLALDSTRLTRLTSEGGIVGTPHCMAPEILGGSESSPQSDLYSVGTIAYRILYGEHFRPEETWAEIFSIPNMSPEEFLPPERLGRYPDWDPWLRRMLRMHPEGRPKSCAEALRKLPNEDRASDPKTRPLPADFELAKATEVLSAKGLGSPRSGRSRPPRGPLPRGWLAGLILLGVGGGIWLSQRPAPEALPKNAEDPSFAILEDHRHQALADLTKARAKLPPVPDPSPEVLLQDLGPLRPFQAANFPAKVMRYLEAIARVQSLDPPPVGTPEWTSYLEATEGWAATYPRDLQKLAHVAERLPFYRGDMERDLTLEANTFAAQFQRLRKEIHLFFRADVRSPSVGRLWLQPDWVLFTMGWALAGGLQLPESALSAAIERLKARQLAPPALEIFGYAVANLERLGLPEARAAQEVTRLMDWAASGPRDQESQAQRDSLLPLCWSLVPRVVQRGESFQSPFLSRTHAWTKDFLESPRSREKRWDQFRGIVGKILFAPDDSRFWNFQDKPRSLEFRAFAQPLQDLLGEP